MAKPLMIFVNDSSIIIKKLWGKWSDFMGNLSSMWQRWPSYNQWPSCSYDLNDLDNMDELVSSSPIFWYCILSTRTPPISLLLLIRIEKALWCFWFGSFPWFACQDGLWRKPLKIDIFRAQPFQNRCFQNFPFYAANDHGCHKHWNIFSPKSSGLSSLTLVNIHIMK